MNKQFADNLQKDLANGLALEWAEMYALDAVSEEERNTLKDYISGDTPEVRSAFDQRVSSARETLALAYAVDEVEPPPGLFDKIVKSLPAEGAAPAPPTAKSDDQPVDELASRRDRRRPSLGRWLIAAAAAVVVAVGGVTVAQNLQPASTQEQILQAADVQRQEIAIGETGTAELAYSKAQDAAVVTLDGVPAPPEGKVYQMWRLPADGASPESLGTMTGEDVAHTELTVEGINSYTALAITVEPEGGSEQPTSPIVVEIPFDA